MGLRECQHNTEHLVAKATQAAVQWADLKAAVHKEEAAQVGDPPQQVVEKLNASSSLREQQEQIRSQLAQSLVAVISQILIPTPDGGRVAGFEVMLTTPAIENHIRKCETFKIGSVIQTSRRQGMMLMDDCLLDLYREGRIDQETALERAFDGKGLLTRMGGGAAE